jgi:predicted TPR repeat methyltransferase
MPSSSTTENARSPLDDLADAEALTRDGRADEALRRLDALREAGRSGLLLDSMRVRALIASGDAEGACAAARETSLLYPETAMAALVLGEAFLAAEHLAVAIGEFHRALRIDPANAAARAALGKAWLAAGEPDKAEDALSGIAPQDAPPDIADMYAEIAAMRARPRADPRYVRHLFDEFSSDYDARMLGPLSYGAPQILRRMAEMMGVTGKLAICDLGCGTGLAGVTFADLASRLDGVDLSPAMIAKAQERGLYNELRVGDLETVLAEDGKAYDLLIAADTLVYLGDLARLFAAAKTRLTQDGLFLFTVERKDGDDYEIGPKRRWRHSESYLRGAAEAAGLTVAGLLECHPRSEAGKPVEGYAVALAPYTNG